MHWFLDPSTSPGAIATGLTDATWTEEDLTTAFGADAGSVGLVCLEFSNTSAGLLAVGAQHPDSTDNLTFGVIAGQNTQRWVCCNSSDVIEVYLADTSEFTVYVVGYLLTSEIEPLTNMVNVSATEAQFSVIDVGSTFTATAYGIVGLLCRPGGGNSVGGVQVYGETDDRVHVLIGTCGFGFILPLNAERFEAYREYTSDVVYAVAAIINYCLGGLSKYGYDESFFPGCLFVCHCVGSCWLVFRFVRSVVRSQYNPFPRVCLLELY